MKTSASEALKITTSQLFPTHEPSPWARPKVSHIDQKALRGGESTLLVAEAQGNDKHEEQSNKPDQESACYLTMMTAYQHADHLSAVLYDRLSGSCRHA